MLNIASKQFIQSQVFYDLPLLKETYKCSSVQIRCKKKFFWKIPSVFLVWKRRPFHLTAGALMDTGVRDQVHRLT